MSVFWTSRTILRSRIFFISRHQSDSLPSGWKPPADSPKTVPFAIRRSRFNNLPVYTDYRNGRARVFTIIRNIEGNLVALEKSLRNHLNAPDILTRVDNLTGQIVLKGNYRNEVKQFFRSLGF